MVEFCAHCKAPELADGKQSERINKHDSWLLSAPLPEVELLVV